MDLYESNARVDKIVGLVRSPWLVYVQEEITEQV